MKQSSKTTITDTSATTDVSVLSDGIGSNRLGVNAIFNSPQGVSITDGPQVDSYGRHRVANPQIQYALYFSNSAHALLFNTAVVGAGSVAFNSTIGSARLSTSTGTTDSIIIQSKRYLRYNPGLSYLLGMSGAMGAPKTNVRQRWGYFDNNDGSFFEQISTGLSVVMRTSTSGSPVDTKIAQASWNTDVMDGSGSAANPSGVLLDPSKHNLYFVDYVWQGAGRVRFGVMVGGKINYVHQISNSNILTAPFWRSPSKPGRVELTNTGAATATTLDIVCVTAVRESVTDTFAPYGFTASNGSTKLTTTSTTPVPLISIRPKATFNGVTNRVPIQPVDFDLVSVQDIALATVILNGTLTGASFASVDANSAAEVDTSATAISGGTKIYQTYVPGGIGKGGIGVETLGDLVVLGLDIAGSTQDVFTIAVNKVAANTDTYASVRWSEFQ